MANALPTRYTKVIVAMYDVMRHKHVLLASLAACAKLTVCTPASDAECLYIVLCVNVVVGLSVQLRVYWWSRDSCFLIICLESVYCIDCICVCEENEK